MRTTHLALLLTFGVLGCGSSQHTPPPAPSAPPSTAQRGGDHDCPMMQGMAGASVAASDTADGVAVAFTTTGDVAALRAHVHRMADMHSGHGEGMHGEAGGADTHGGMGSGMHGGPGMHGEGSGMHGEMEHMVPARVSVEDLPNGARLVIVPNDPSQLAALRARVHEHAAMMAKGECPMKGMHPESDEHAQRHPSG